jgi:hypothetical protein
MSRTQEFRKDLAKTLQAVRPTIATMSAKQTKVSKLRMAAGVGVATVGPSFMGSLMPSVASADPWVPYSGPLHPVRHYEANVTHPLLTLTHPIRAAMP